LFDLDDKAKQTEFASLVGASQPAIHKHLDNGTLVRGGTYRQWLRAYCEKLRDEASGRTASDQRLKLDEARTREASANARMKELMLFKEEQLILDKAQVREAIDGWIALAKSEYTNSIEKILAMLESQHGITIDRESIDGTTAAAMRVIADFQFQSTDSD